MVDQNEDRSRGQRVAYLRRRLDLTQQQLADRLPGLWTAKEISRRETGERGIPEGQLPDFARALEIPLSTLRGDEVAKYGATVTVIDPVLDPPPVQAVAHGGEVNLTIGR